MRRRNFELAHERKGTVGPNYHWHSLVIPINAFRLQLNFSCNYSHIVHCTTDIAEGIERGGRHLHL